jgi:phosphate-selective porin
MTTMKKTLFIIVLPVLLFLGNQQSIAQTPSLMPKLSGFINLRYQYEDGNNSFDIRRARLDLKGDPVKWMDYRLQLDVSSSPKIMDAFVRLKFHPMFNVQAGQFKLAFSLENPYSPLALETLDNSQVISYLSGFNDLSGNKAAGRDMGIAVYGGFFQQDGYNIIDYIAGFYNGNGINLKDNNKHKDFSGRLEIHPIRALTLSASYYNGKLGTDNDLKPKTRLGFGLRFDNGTYLLRGEYISGTTDKTCSDGFYVVAGYTIAGIIQPLVKYDRMRLDKEDSGLTQTNYVVGLDWWPHHNFRFQINYTYRTFENKDTNSGLLGLMLTARF